MLSLGMLTALASLIAYRRRRFVSGSPPPSFAATIMAFDSFVHNLPRLASTAAFRCLIFAQGEWPAIEKTKSQEPRTKFQIAIFARRSFWFFGSWNLRCYRGFFFTRPLAVARDG